MFAVCVTFRIKPDHMARFLPLTLANAQTSLRDEIGCRRFDVLTDPSRPDEVFLYELYEDAAAFDVHLASDHFHAFDKAVGDMIAQKDIRTYTSVAT